MFKLAAMAKHLNSVGKLISASSEFYQLAADNGGDDVLKEIDVIAAHHLKCFLEDVTPVAERFETLIPEADRERIKENLTATVIEAVAANNDLGRSIEGSNVVKVIAAHAEAQMAKRFESMADEEEEEEPANEE